MARKTRLALIGCGGISKSHVSRFEKCTDRLDVVAAVDVRLEKAKGVADLLPNCRAATDFHDVLDDVDAVLLALPHYIHRDVSVDCLNAGKHVLVEKPLANSRQECLDMMDAAKRNNRTLMVAYCMRYHPFVLKIKELLDNKTYGEVFQASIWTEQLTFFKKDDPNRFGIWAHDARKLGGGQLFSHGCHYIDLLMWYLGRPISGVHMGSNRCVEWMEMEGTSNVTLMFPNGVMGYHFGTWGARGTRLNYSYHFHCSEAMIEADIVGGKLYVHKGSNCEVLMQDLQCKPMEREMAHFLDCIETGQEPITNAADSLKGLEVIWKLYEAERTGTIADLREGSPMPDSSFAD